MSQELWNNNIKSFFFFSSLFCYLHEFSWRIFRNKKRMSWLFGFQYVNLRAQVALPNEVE